MPIFKKQNREVVVRFLRSLIPGKKNDRNIVAERGQMVRIMPPEIEEQEPGKTKIPENKKSADSTKHKRRFYLKLFFRCLQNNLKTRRDRHKLFYESYCYFWDIVFT